jgi:hypothetical protein
MVKVIHLKSGALPPENEAHALVITSPSPPVEGASVIDRGPNRTFFADDSEEDIALIVGRASVWADEQGMANVYVARRAPVEP